VPAAAVTPAPVAHRPFVAVKVLVVKTEGEIRGSLWVSGAGGRGLTTSSSARTPL
jgi:hypothetical protein